MTTNKKNAEDQDCLHCVLWPVIRKFCAEHPNGYVTDVLDALADVIGDQLASEGSRPYQEEFILRVEKRIRKRIRFGLAHLKQKTRRS
jgi:hypothetical protein